MSYIIENLNTDGYENAYIDVLIEDGDYWSVDKPINVGFFTGYSDYHQRTSLDWSEAEKNTFALAMNSYSDVSNITFNVINNPSESVSVDNNIDILWYKGPEFVNGESSLYPAVLAWHQQPNYDQSSNGLWNWVSGVFNSEFNLWGEFTPSSWAYMTIIHEFGHGLALRHTHDGVKFPGVVNCTDLGGVT